MADMPAKQAHAISYCDPNLQYEQTVARRCRRTTERLDRAGKGLCCRVRTQYPPRGSWVPFSGLFGQTGSLQNMDLGTLKGQNRQWISKNLQESVHGWYRIRSCIHSPSRKRGKSVEIDIDEMRRDGVLTPGKRSVTTIDHRRPGRQLRECIAGVDGLLVRQAGVITSCRSPAYHRRQQRCPHGGSRALYAPETIAGPSPEALPAGWAFPLPPVSRSLLCQPEKRSLGSVTQACKPSS